ncbi:MAG: type II secretion system protein N [Burkholderiaceae bacterium]
MTAPPVAIAPAGSIVDYGNAPDLGPAAQLFGQRNLNAQAQPASSNIQVLGVAASARRASAVLSVDGGPAKAFMVGDEVSDGVRLVAVRADAAVIEQGGKRIELVAPQRPSLAILSGGTQPGGSSAGTATNPPVGTAPAVPVPVPPPAPPAPSGQPAQPMQPMPPQSAISGTEARPSTFAPPPQQAPSSAADPADPAAGAAAAPEGTVGEVPAQFRRR